MKKSTSRAVWIISVIIFFGLVATLSIYWKLGQPRQPAGPPEQLTIGINATYIGTSPIFVASENGYFKEAGLEVTIKPYASGRDALSATMDGQADIATVAETPLMSAAMQGKAISIVATICTSGQDYGIVARKDRGITIPSDLKGKRVAVTLGTSAHYLLDAILVRNNVRPAQLQITNLNPAQALDALSKGDVDAVSIWEPYLSVAANALSDNGIVISADTLYVSTYNLAGRREFVARHPEAMQRLLRALIRAEQFITERPAEARAITGHATGIEPSVMDRLWPKYNLRVTLDQGLLTVLEAQARWAIRYRYTEQAEVPNFLNYLYTDAIAKVKPDALSIIH